MCTAEQSHLNKEILPLLGGQDLCWEWLIVNNNTLVLRCEYAGKKINGCVYILWITGIDLFGGLTLKRCFYDAGNIWMPFWSIAVQFRVQFNEYFNSSLHPRSDRLSFVVCRWKRIMNKPVNLWHMNTPRTRRAFSRSVLGSDTVVSSFYSGFSYFALLSDRFIINTATARVSWPGIFIFVTLLRDCKKPFHCSCNRKTITKKQSHSKEKPIIGHCMVMKKPFQCNKETIAMQISTTVLLLLDHSWLDSSHKIGEFFRFLQQDFTKKEP